MSNNDIQLSGFKLADSSYSWFERVNGYCEQVTDISNVTKVASFVTIKIKISGMIGQTVILYGSPLRF